MSDLQARQIESLLPQVGSMVGGPVGGAIGTALDVLGGLFGGKVHTTPSGMTYSQATGTMRDQEVVLNQLWTQYYGTALDVNVPPVGDTGDWWWYMTGLIARYLNNPALQTRDPKKFDTLKKNGSVDSAVQVQRSLIQVLTAKLAQGSVASAPASAAAPATTAAAGATANTAATAPAASASLLASVEGAIPETIFGIKTTYLLIGLAALAVVTA
jgi:hypothetical protein